MADLIDRQKIKAKFEPWLKVTDYSEGELNMLKAVLYEITVMPSAQPDVPDTNVGDMISRQAAIDAIDALCDRECEYSKKQRSVMCGACHLGSAFDVIEQLPSVEAEPARHGHWIKHENPRLGICMRVSYECSSCGIWLGCENFNRRSYCPNCGARMDGEQNG